MHKAGLGVDCYPTIDVDCSILDCDGIRQSCRLAVWIRHSNVVMALTQTASVKIDPLRRIEFRFGHVSTRLRCWVKGHRCPWIKSIADDREFKCIF